MTVTLRLSPEVEASLLVRAGPSGVALEQYILSLVEEVALKAEPTVDAALQAARQEAVRRMLELGEKHRLTLGEPITRKVLHQEHRR